MVVVTANPKAEKNRHASPQVLRVCNAIYNYYLFHKRHSLKKISTSEVRKKEKFTQVCNTATMTILNPSFSLYSILLSNLFQELIG